MSSPGPGAQWASTEERRQQGRALRRVVPRSSHALFQPAAPLPDRLGVVESANEGRIPGLVPIRFGRMALSPFAFFRGAAALMAGDLALTPTTGLAVQLCGDAHLTNFGLYATPERRLVFGVNDFDETLPGPWEWDVKRLAASVAVAARTNEFDDRDSRKAAIASVRSYRERMSTYSRMKLLELWYSTVEVDVVVDILRKTRHKAAQRAAAKAHDRDHLRALSKLTEEVSGTRKIRHAPPLLIRIDDLPDLLFDALGATAEYRAGLAEEQRFLFDRFQPIDVAMKVVGVGSVGTHCFIGLLQGESHDDPLFLQAKEANASVLEAHLGPSRHGHHGQRIVVGQRLMLAFPDIFLGWTTTPATGRQYYIRQLQDMKGSFPVDTMGPTDLAGYSSVCGWALARAHARSGDAAAISGYLGTSATFDEAVGDFALACADQNDADHAALVAAIASGRVSAALDL